MAGHDGLRSPVDPVRRLRREIRRAARDLAEFEDAHGAIGCSGVYRLAPGEPADDQLLLDYLRQARADHPDQELVIAVTAKPATALPTPSPQPGA